jgi:ligand-binding SRPBCC domain-containing protein
MTRPIPTDLFVYRSAMPASALEVFRWHERPDALVDLLPSRWVRLVRRTGGVRDGGVVVIAIGRWPFRWLWEARHDSYVEGVRFRDEQISGPFAVWRHTHRCEAVDDRHSVLEDQVEYAMRGGRMVRWMAAPFARRALKRMFERRHAIVWAQLLAGTPGPKNDVA